VTNVNEKIIICIFLGSIVDAFTTYILLRISIGEEQNPILRRLLERYGERALIFWPPIETALTCFFAFITAHIFTRNYEILTYIVISIPWIASAYNTAQIVSILIRQ